MSSPFCPCLLKNIIWGMTCHLHTFTFCDMTKTNSKMTVWYIIKRNRKLEGGRKRIICHELVTNYIRILSSKNTISSNPQTHFKCFLPFGLVMVIVNKWFILTQRSCTSSRYNTTLYIIHSNDIYSIWANKLTGTIPPLFPQTAIATSTFLSALLLPFSK